jgi:hypothetical protein
MTRVKKIKLILDDELEFPILGISTALSDYRLAWQLNTDLDLNFQKGDDGFYLPNKNREMKLYEYYIHENDDDFSKFFLVKNKQNASVLFTQNDKLDFFLILRENNSYILEELIKKLRNIKGIVAIFSFPSSNFEFSEYLND